MYALIVQIVRSAQVDLVIRLNIAIMKERRSNWETVRKNVRARGAVMRLLNQVINFFSRPPEDILTEEEKEISRFVHGILLATLGILAIRMTGSFGSHHAFAALACLFIFLVVLFIPLRQGRVKGSGIAAVTAAWATMTWLAWHGQGVTDGAAICYIILIMMASLVRSPRFTITIFSISILSVWGLALAQAGNRLTSPPDSPFVLAADLTAIMAIAAIMVLMYAQSFIRGRIRITAEFNERKRAEAALRESEERFQSFMRYFPGLAYIKDDKGRIIFANEGFTRYLGIDTANLLGKTNYEMFPRDFADKITEDDRRVLSTGQIETVEESFGNRIWSTSKFPITRPNTGPLLGGVTLDISERKAAEEALRQAAQEWQITFDSVHDAVWVLDSNQRVVRTNRAAMKIFNCSFSNIQGKPCWETAHGTDYPIEGCPFTKMRSSLIRETKEIWEGERLFEVTVDPIMDEAGQFKGAVHIVSDITHRRQLETQLNQAQKMEAVGLLAGGVAHDFNNLLQVILGYAEFVLNSTPPHDPRHTDLHEILKAGNRASDLTRQLLAFARKQTIVPRVMNLNETIEGMLKMLRRLIGENIDLVWAAGPDLWPVRIDPSQVDQILANLALNARDAIPGTGRVHITTENKVVDDDFCFTHADATPGDYAVLSVTDTGIGMEKAILDRLFEPFFTTKGTGHGTGLGLATIYGIVRQNQGFIDVLSQPDQGSTFRVYLPRHRGTSLAPAPQPPDRTDRLDGAGKTVLLVEDDQRILELGKRMLGQLGYTVLTAGTPSEALRQVAEHGAQIHLIITDVILPEMSGRDLASRVQTLHPTIKVIFMSGYATDVINRHGVETEEINFLQKPFTAEALADKVHCTLAGPC